MHKNMKEMEQYNDERFVVKSVYKGEQSEAILLFLTPGQEMPSHPHERFEVVLVPRNGTGLLVVDGGKVGARNVALIPGTLYYEPSGKTFSIKNVGLEPFQTLITLIRVEAAAHPAQPAPEPEGNPL